MQNMWERISKVVLYIVIIWTLAFTSIAPVASAAAISAIEQIPATINPSEDQVSPQMEETTWCFRNYNGRAQRRLWSNTRGIWLTDWIDC